MLELLGAVGPGQERQTGQAAALTSQTSSAFQARSIFRNMTTKKVRCCLSNGSILVFQDVLCRPEDNLSVISYQVSTIILGLFVLVVHIRMFCLHVWLCITCVRCLRRPEEGADSPEPQIVVNGHELAGN